MAAVEYDTGRRGLWRPKAYGYGNQDTGAIEVQPSAAFKSNPRPLSASVIRSRPSAIRHPILSLSPVRLPTFIPMFFDLYWRWLGLPLSRLKGLATDAVPFSLVEASLWMGAAATLLWIVSWTPRGGRLRRPAMRGAAFALGPLFLVVLSLGQ